MKILAFTFKIYWAQLTNKVGLTRRGFRHGSSARRAWLMLSHAVQLVTPAAAAFKRAVKRSSASQLCTAAQRLRIAHHAPPPPLLPQSPPRHAPQVDLTIVATSVLLLALDTFQLEAVKVSATHQASPA